MSVLVPGMEGRHSWNGLVLGDQEVWPRHRVAEIAGLRATGDAEDVREPRTGMPGEIARRSFRRGKTVTYECVTEARSLAELRQAQAARSAAFEELDAEGVMTITTDPLLPNAPPPVFFRARCLSLIPGTERPADPGRMSMGFEQPFTVALRLADRRIYRAQQAGPFETAALVAESGISLPVTAPFTIPAPGTTSGVVSVTNEGDAETDPTIDLYGPVRDPRIMNDTLGVELRFAGLELVAGQFLRVDFLNRRVLLEGTADYRAKLDRTRSSWWEPGVAGLAPGANVVRYRGEGMSDPARAVLTFYHAAPS